MARAFLDSGFRRYDGLETESCSARLGGGEVPPAWQVEQPRLRRPGRRPPGRPGGIRGKFASRASSGGCVRTFLGCRVKYEAFAGTGFEVALFLGNPFLETAVGDDSEPGHECAFRVSSVFQPHCGGKSACVKQRLPVTYPEICPSTSPTTCPPTWRSNGPVLVSFAQCRLPGVSSHH